MISISLCMIVKDKADVLERCLGSIAPIIDEIVIVDTGSRDRTREIAFQYTDRLLHFACANDFAAARNYALDAATQDYILWLEADDMFLPDDQLKLLKLKQTLQSDIDSVSMLYELTRDEYGNVIHSLRNTRLVKRSCHFRWQGAIPEWLSVYGYTLLSDIAVAHQLHRDPDSVPARHHLQSG